MTPRTRAMIASVMVYAALTMYFGRDVLANLSSSAAGDEGDPVFVAAILHWNATTVPLTERWWQFPIFDPTRDALAFSEHFLGVAPISTPLEWAARDPLVTYNIVTLLTFPLCGLTMAALAYRLTRNGAAAFLAGLAFAFAPYRMSQLPHLQMLAAFWAPLALLGLHAYIETRRKGWLALYGLTWMLQAAANTYMLVFLSVLIAFWVIWFVVARRDWRALVAIAVATLAAALPIAPIVAKYISVHALHGFVRNPHEIRMYSADLAAVLCAPVQLTFWAWLQTACRAEGQLFPGIAAAAVAALALFRVMTVSLSEPWPRRSLTVASRAVLVLGLGFLVVVGSVVVAGPWALEAGPLRISASSIAKPLMAGTAGMVLSVLLSPGVREAFARSSPFGFYVVAALLTWVLALGPTLTFMGEPRGFQAPFALLMYLPGVSGLRVPARFWLITTMCLAVVGAYTVAALIGGRRRPVVTAVVITGTVLVLIDGWIDRIHAAPVQRAVPDARVLRNATVLSLPMGVIRDIAAEFRGVVGGWRSVNGYSGYGPRYYVALSDAAHDEDPAAIVPFVARGDLHVVVDEDARGLRQMIERFPGAGLTARSTGTVQYFIPRSDMPQAWKDRGERVTIREVRASCAAADAGRAADGDERTRWECGPQRPGEEIVIDLGGPADVGAVTQSVAEYHGNYPKRLEVETSLDGRSWETAWNGSVRALFIAQALDNASRVTRITVPFTRRQARFIRLRQLASDDFRHWTVAELEIWSGSTTSRLP